MDARYAAFVEECEKIAAEVVRSRSELEKHLKPGDILVTTNAPTHHGGSLAGRLADRFLKFGIRTVYGDAGHAAIYTGDGKTVEMSSTLKHWDLSNSTRGKDVHVFRPDADSETRKAVARALVLKAKKQGKEIQYVPPSTLAKALVEEFVGRKVYDDKTSPAGEDQRYTCTNVIAAAYKAHGVDLAPKKTVALVSPTDFIKSERTSKVVSYFNPLRHDRDRRRGIEEHEKAAGDTSSLSELRESLQPGDILITSPIKNTSDPRKNPLKWAGEAAFKGVNRALYGDDAHSALYVGDDKAVEFRRKLQKVPLKDVTAARDVKVLRPEASAEVRREAAERMVALQKSKQGRSARYASLPWQLKLLAADTSLRPLVAMSHDAELKDNRPICSNIISEVYKDHVVFDPKKPHGFITPKDLATSPRVSHVINFINKKRWDAERREPKTAEEDRVSTVSSLLAKARPGDVILTSQGPFKPSDGDTAARRTLVKAFDTVNRWRSGVDNTHAAMYVGKGEAVEMVVPGVLRTRPVSKVVTARDAKLIRPNVSAEEARAAAKKMVSFTKGDEVTYASKPWIGKLLLSDTPLRKFVLKDHDSDLKQNKAICSNLVSKAYEGVVDFSEEKPYGYVTPRDILESKNVSKVTRYLNRRRWDAERREA